MVLALAFLLMDALLIERRGNFDVMVMIVFFFCVFLFIIIFFMGRAPLFHLALQIFDADLRQAE
jgi:hypothetical protein